MTSPSAFAEPQPLLDLQRLLLAIRRRRRLWLWLAVLGFLIGAMVPIAMPSPPKAVTSVLVVHEDDPSDAGAIDTDVAVLETTRIAGAALSRLHEHIPAEAFLKSYEAVGVTNNVLKLTVRGPSYHEAVVRAKALAEAFIADHVGRMRAAAEAEANALLDQRKQAKADLARIDAAIAGSSGSDGGASASLYSQRAELISRIADLGKRAQDAKIGDPRVAAGTQIVDAPRPVPYSLFGAVGMDAGIGLVLGLVIGLAAAAVTGIVRDRPVLRSEIAEHLGASVIAELAVQHRGPGRIWRRSRGVADRTRVAGTLARALRGDRGPVSILELGCPRATAALTLDVAAELATTDAVTILDDLPGHDLRELAREEHEAVRVVGSGEREGDAGHTPAAVRIGVGTVTPGTPWTDLRRLGRETVLVVRAGFADAAWLHTVARQLADVRVLVLGVVIVDPDPRDRSDGTLWDGLHTALRGRAAHVAGPGDEEPVSEMFVPSRPPEARAGEPTENRQAPTTRLGRAAARASGRLAGGVQVETADG